MFNQIMVAFDGTEISTRALEVGAELAAKLSIPIQTVTVIEDVPAYVGVMEGGAIDPASIELIDEQRNAYARQLLQRVKDVASRFGIEIQSEMMVGDAVEIIVDAVDRHSCDLLVIGFRAHPGLIERLVPHRCNALANRARCSVLGVR